MIDQIFGKVLKQFRTERGLSQEEFGLQANLHRTYVSQLERGLKSPSLKTQHKITAVLNIKLSDFMLALEQELDNVSAQ